MREVAVLCVAQKSPYKGMPGVETFDKRRNVRTFKGGMPVVAHPERCKHCTTCDLLCPDFAITGVRKRKVST